MSIFDIKLEIMGYKYVNMYHDLTGIRADYIQLRYHQKSTNIS